MVSPITFSASLVLALTFLGADAFDMGANNNVCTYCDTWQGLRRLTDLF